MNKKIYIILSILVFVFLIARAILVPLVHDEIATYFYYIQQIDWNPLTGANPDANNHILNSILAGITHKYLGYSTFSIRLPNLLSFIPYAFFVYKIGQKLTKTSTKGMYYIGMLFPIYFIQFFALSRGYGMSMAFLIGAIYYTLNLYEKKSLSNITFGSICLILAIYANMSLLPLSLLFFIIMGVLVLVRRKEYNYPISLVTIFFNLILIFSLLFFAIKIAFKMKEEGSLYYGELDGFWQTTIQSELLMFFETYSSFSQLFLILTIILVILVFSFKLLKDKLSSILKPEYLHFYLLIGIIVGIQIMAIVLKINYPEDRVGMYLYPLLLGALCFGVDTSELKLNRYFLLPILIIPIHFFSSINFYKTSQWKSGYIPTRFYEAIKDHETETKYPATVGGDAQRIFIYIEKIYNDTNKSANTIQLWEKTLFDTTNGTRKIVLPNHPGKNCDYLITNKKYIQDILPLYDSIDKAYLTKFVLYKRKEPVKKELIIKTNKISKGEISNEFFEFFHQEFDSLSYDAMMIGFDLEIQSLSHPFRSRIIVEIREENKKTGKFTKIHEDFFQLNWMYPTMEAKNPIIKSIFLNNLKHYTKNGKIEIVVYLWNIDKKPHSIYKGEIEIFKVVE